MHGSAAGAGGRRRGAGTGTECAGLPSTADGAVGWHTSAHSASPRCALPPPSRRRTHRPTPPATPPAALACAPLTPALAPPPPASPPSPTSTAPRASCCTAGAPRRAAVQRPRRRPVDAALRRAVPRSWLRAAPRRAPARCIVLGRPSAFDLTQARAPVPPSPHPLHFSYPIEELAAEGDFIDSTFLLLHGELPSKQEKALFEREIKYHTLVHEQLIQFYRWAVRGRAGLPGGSAARRVARVPAAGGASWSAGQRAALRPGCCVVAARLPPRATPHMPCNL